MASDYSDMLPMRGVVVPYKNKKTGFTSKLYPIGTVALMLGRDTSTLRRWEIQGTIPKTPFIYNGRRMYCTEQIDIIVACAEHAHLGAGRSISSTRFTIRVQRQWKELFAKIFGESEVVSNGEEED